MEQQFPQAHAPAPPAPPPQGIFPQGPGDAAPAAFRAEAPVPADERVAEHLVPEVELRRHLRTWRVFTHLVKWFAIHLLVDLVGVYCIVVLDNTPAGLMFATAGTTILIWGIVTIPRDVPRDYLHPLQ